MTQGTPSGSPDDDKTVFTRPGQSPGGGQQYGQSQPDRHGQQPTQQFGQPQGSQQYGAPQGQYGAPQGGQQQYGQSSPGYGQPQGSPGYGQPYGVPGHGPQRTERAVGVTGLVLTALGLAAALVGLFALSWLRGIDGDPKFLDYRDAFGSGLFGEDATLTKPYFQWAAFVLLGVTLVCAVVACLPSGAAPVFRALGLVIGLVAAAYTVFAPILDDSDGAGDYLKNGLGYYAVAGGLVLMAIGAVTGSRRRA